MLNNTCHLSRVGILILPNAFCTAVSGQEQRRTPQTSLSCPGTTCLLLDSPLSRALPTRTGLLSLAFRHFKRGDTGGEGRVPYPPPGHYNSTSLWYSGAMHTRLRTRRTREPRRKIRGELDYDTRASSLKLESKQTYTQRTVAAKQQECIPNNELCA